MSRDNLQKLILEILSDAKEGRVSDEKLTQRAVRSLAHQFPVRTDERKVAPKYVINRTIKRMYRSGIIESEDIQEQKYVFLTDEGQQRLEKMRGYAQYLDQTQTWDGKWRMVILNFSEDQKGTRESIRRILKEVGFKSIKNSIWIYPLDVSELLETLREEFDIDQELIYVVADSIDKTD